MIKRSRRVLEAIEMDAIRWSRKEMIRNEEVKQGKEAEGFIMKKSRLPKQIIEWTSVGRQRRERPKTTSEMGIWRVLSEKDLAEQQCNNRLE